jgi:hypothetical protein
MTNRGIGGSAAVVAEQLGLSTPGHLSISHLARLRFRGARKMVEVASEGVDQARETLAPEGGSKLVGITGSCS